MAKLGIKSAIVLALMLTVVHQPQAAQHHLLVIAGIGGEKEYRSLFSEMAMSIYKSAKIVGIEEQNIIMLSAEPLPSPTQKYRESSKDNINDALKEISVRSQTDDRVFVILIGHGNARGSGSVFNIPGPDISAEEFAVALNAFDGQTLVIVNAASASGPFVKELSSENRIIITATASGREYNATIFGQYFLTAFSESAADRDKDERISLLEAFDYARREVRRKYDGDKRLLTEHALLDDNGDGVGSIEPGENKKDGTIAKNIYLQQPSVVVAAAGGALAKLLQRKQELEDLIFELKTQRESIDRVDYYNKLEALLIELALIAREIREHGG
ncbi:C13 family peptidase [Pseudomonadota bacterium]